MAELYEVSKDSYRLFEPLMTERARREYMTEPDCLAVGAVDRGEACGIMLLEIKEMNYFVSYIHISEAYRKKGIATQLLELAESMGCQNEKLLFASFYAEDEDEPVYRLFRSYSGLELEELEGGVYRIPVEELESAEERLSKRSGGYEILPFMELPEEKRQGFIDKCAEEGIAYFDRGASDYIDSLCLAAVKDDRLLAAVLVREGDAEEEIVLEYVFSTDPLALAGLLKEASSAARRLPGGISHVRIPVVNEEAEKLLLSILPSAVRIGRYYMASLDLKL